MYHLARFCLKEGRLSHADAFPVVVVGAGLAGLSAASHLAGRGLPVLLMEADSSYAGGRLSGGPAETFEYNGRLWSFDSQHGIHALWGNYDNMRAMLGRFLPTLTLRPCEGEAWINRWGTQVRAVEAGTAVRETWIPAPLHYLQLLLRPRFWTTITPLDFLSLPAFLISLLWVTGIDPLQEELPLNGLTMDDFFRGWTPNLKATFVGLAHSLLAAPSDKISLTAFIAAMRFYTFLRRDSWRLEFFPTNPHTSLIQPLLARIEAAEGKTLFGAYVQSLRPQGGGWQVRFADLTHGGLTRTLEAQHVILAVQPTAARTLLLAGEETRPAAEGLCFPPTLRNATLRLWFSRPPKPGPSAGMFTGDFLMDNFFWLHCMQDEFQEWGQVTGGSAIEVHLYASDAILNKPDSVLLIEGVKEVQTAFPELRGAFVHGSVRRNSATQTQLLIPTAQTLGVTTPWEGVFACGDWVRYPSPSLWMERATITGMAAANAVLERLGHAPYDILPPRPPEALARLIGGGVRLGRRAFAPLLAVLRHARKAHS